MKLSLNIYDGKKIEKTYTTDTYDLLYGTLEDLIKCIDTDKLNSFGINKDNVDNKFELGKMVISLLPQIKPILKSIFDGITDDEIRRTKVKELIPIFVEAFTYAFSEINGLNNNDNSGN